MHFISLWTMRINDLKEIWMHFGHLGNFSLLGPHGVERQL